MGQIRDTSNWTSEQKAARISAARAILTAGQMVRSNIRIFNENRILLWLLTFGNSTSRILTSLVDSSPRILSTLVQEEMIFFGKALIQRTTRTTRHGQQTRLIHLVMLTAKGAKFARGLGYTQIPRQRAIEDQKYLRHNLLVQVICCNAAKELRNFQLDWTAYSPRSLNELPYGSVLSKCIYENRLKPDALISVAAENADHYFFNKDRIPPSIASQVKKVDSVPIRFNDEAIAIELERSKKTSSELARLVKKLHLLDRCRCTVILSTETRNHMDSLISSMEEFTIGGVPFETKNLRKLVLEESPWCFDLEPILNFVFEA